MEQFEKELEDYEYGEHQGSSCEEDSDEQILPVKIEEPLIDKFLKMIIISPENWFFHAWKIFVLFLSIISSLVYANFAAFREDVNFKNYMDYFDKDDYGYIVMHKYSYSDLELFNKLQLGIECFFLVEMLFGFITEYVDENNKSIKDIKKIGKKYLSEGFILDLLPLIPFNWLFHFKKSQYLFLLKSIRLIQAYEILDVRVFNTQIGLIFKKKLEVVCNNPELAVDQNIDHNHIILQILIKYMLRTLKLIISILIISYYCGIFFFIWCDLTNHLDINSGESILFDSSNPIFEMNHFDATLAMMYWAFTTLSTVGLGDYYPMSNYERALSSFGFLMGVAVFSYIMGNFAEIIQFIMDINNELEEGEQLTIFLSLLKSFNNDEDIKLELKEHIENYFLYRWENNQNWAVETESDKLLLS